MTTVGLPDTSTYTTIELVSCLVTPSARAYGSEGWGFESLRARSLTSLNAAVYSPAPPELSRIVTTRAKLCAASLSASGCECTYVRIVNATSA